MNIITVLIMYFILIVLEPSFLILYIYMVNTLSYYYSTFVILSVYSTILKPAQNLNRYSFSWRRTMRGSSRKPFTLHLGRHIGITCLEYTEPDTPTDYELRDQERTYNNLSGIQLYWERSSH